MVALPLPTTNTMKTPVLLTLFALANSYPVTKSEDFYLAAYQPNNLLQASLEIVKESPHNIVVDPSIEDRIEGFVGPDLKVNLTNSQQLTVNNEGRLVYSNTSNTSFRVYRDRLQYFQGTQWSGDWVICYPNNSLEIGYVYDNLDENRVYLRTKPVILRPYSLNGHGMIPSYPLPLSLV